MSEEKKVLLKHLTKMIFDNVDHRNMMSMGRHGEKAPEFGDYVITGMVMGAGQQLGYLTQIRQKAGMCGSDKVFLRHPDGKLMTHENQCFWIIDPEWKPVLDLLFEIKPEDEKADNLELEYRCCDKVGAKGFIIKTGSVPKSKETLTFGVTIKK